MKVKLATIVTRREGNQVTINVLRQLVIAGLLVLTNNALQAQGNPHVKVNFPCQTCHNTEEWKNVRFDHSQTGFDLTGQHAKRRCTDCHNLKDFIEVQKNCTFCHVDVHQARLYQDCDRCHTTQNWILLDPYKAHASTSMQILGSHTRLDCRVCHRGEVEGEWMRVRSNCADCHLQDYLSAENPVHSDLGFGKVCEDCHSQISWLPGSYKKHDAQFFPIFSGSHAGVWKDCTTCHYQFGNYSVFSCFLNCHEHDKAKTDGKHDEVPNYRYDSELCYQCHRSGKGDD